MLEHPANVPRRLNLDAPAGAASRRGKLELSDGLEAHRVKIMQVYVFKGRAGWYGFTDEPSGQKLPVDKGPWTPDETSERAMFKEQQHQADRIGGLKESDVLKGIQNKGFYLWKYLDAPESLESTA
jgi:hypothetical protein